MVKLFAGFVPMRLRISDRAPVQMSVEIVNDENERKTVSLYLSLGKELSFEKGGFKTDRVIKIDSLNAGSSKKYYFEIWAKPHTEEGDQTIKLTLLEHYKDDYSTVKKETERDLSLTVC